MAISVYLGKASRAAERHIPQPERRLLRVYTVRHQDYYGTDTTDLLHFCNDACARSYLFDRNYTVIGRDKLALLEDDKLPEQITTADMTAFDRGDDTSAVCLFCGTYL